MTDSGDINKIESHALLLPAIERLMSRCNVSPGASVMDLGCGCGHVVKKLSDSGYAATGVDLDPELIDMGRLAYPALDLHQGSGEDDLASRFGSYDVVISMEVIEHVHDPVSFMSTVRSLLKPSGICIMSTPYHGYAKNLAISVLNGWDRHLDPFWKGGHIKLWSERTLRKLADISQMKVLHLQRVGRIPILAKSMLMVLSTGVSE